MTRLLIGLLASLAVAASLAPDQARATWPTPHIADRWARRHAMTMPWRGPYYNTSYGAPVALVVPPTANSYTHLSWGVAQSETRPIYHQYSSDPRVVFGIGRVVMGGGVVQPMYGTPQWPSNTDQFGVYYVRAPW